MECCWNVKLMKWQVYKMSNWWSGKSVKGHIDEMSSCQNKIFLWNGKLAKWKVGKLAKWQFDEMSSWPNDKKNKKNSYLMKVGEMSNWQVGQMTSWHNGKLVKWHVAKMKKVVKMLSRWNVNSTKRPGTIYFGSRLLQHQIRESAQTGEIKTNGYSELCTINSFTAVTHASA